MKIETLKERIKKSEEKIAKLNGTLERHKSQLVKKAKVVTDKGIDLNNYNKYDRKVVDHDTYWDLCDYESKLDDIKNNEKKIVETTKALEKSQEQLNNQLAKDEEISNSVPEALNVFLERWKQKCYDFFMTLANEYVTLLNKDHNEYEITKEELDKLEKREYIAKRYRYEYVKRFTDDEIEDILKNPLKEHQKDDLKYDIKEQHVRDFKNKHFASDMAVLNKIIQDYTINENILNKILDYEVKAKREMFVSRIKQVIGDIKDLTGLKIGLNGEINGIAKGVKCNAKVDTITAGGYHIQCFHFRVLVNTIK